MQNQTVNVGRTEATTLNTNCHDVVPISRVPIKTSHVQMVRNAPTKQVPRLEDKQGTIPRYANI